MRSDGEGIQLPIGYLSNAPYLKLWSTEIS